ncbi:carbon-nitrogen hydrolase family protein, partial [Klebsiella pneumoniae]|nr:carbon-nitrogen hydrolase family protein [Klebsiella pneumoniae]
GTNLLVQDRARREALLADEDADVAVAGLKALAAELGVWLLVGSAILKSGHADDPRAANRSLLFDDQGQTVARYDKLHVYDVDLPT